MDAWTQIITVIVLFLLDFLFFQLPLFVQGNRVTASANFLPSNAPVLPVKREKGMCRRFRNMQNWIKIFDQGKYEQMFPWVSISPALEYERLNSPFTRALVQNRHTSIFKKKMSQVWMICTLISTHSVTPFAISTPESNLMLSLHMLLNLCSEIVKSQGK